MTTWTHPGADYRSRLPQSIHDEGMDSNGNPDPTSLDRRWLWRMESFLAVYGTNETQHQMGADLRYYLNETCGHHWKSYVAEADIAAHRQCSWCNDVEWTDSEAVAW
jgi:hypothetical protein